MSDDCVIAALGIGGNLGETKQNLIDAISRLDHHESVVVTSVSKLYKTPPWGKLDQPSFLNACLLIETTLSAQDLLELCLQIEQELGRVRAERWGPRLVDIDVLYYSDEKITADGLEVPHPRMTERAFVMQPLSDIDNDKVIEGKAVGDWSRLLAQDDIEQICNDGNWWK